MERIEVEYKDGKKGYFYNTKDNKWLNNNFTIAILIVVSLFVFFIVSIKEIFSRK